MAMQRFHRRVIAGMLGAFGVVLMLVAPDTLAGVAILALAVAIEVAGILIERRR